MDIWELFKKFNLQILPQEWTEMVTDDNYSKEIVLPVQYETYLSEQDISIGDLLMKTRLFIFNWLTECRPNITNGVNSKNTWKTLLNKGVQHKALLCLLNTFIQGGKNNLKNENSRQLCLKAIGLYFMLLAIPGSNVFLIFNTALYSNLMESLRAICEDLTINGRSKVRPNKMTDHVLDTFNRGNSCEYGLKELLNDFIFFINRFKLSGQQHCLDLTINVLVLITRVKIQTCNMFSGLSGQQTVPALSYVALKDLCKTNHGEVKENVRLIMKQVIHGILPGDNALKNNKAAVIIQKNSIQFINFLLSNIGEPAFEGVKILAQQICVRSPDRVEERVKYVQLALEVMKTFPDELYSEFEIWIMKLSHNDHVKNRLTGLELVGKLLLSYPCKRHNKLSLKFLIGTIFSRYIDNVPTVKAKALSILGQLLSSKNYYVQREIKKIFTIPCEDTQHLVSNKFRKNRYKKDNSFQNVIKEIQGDLPVSLDPLPDINTIIQYLEQVLKDDKVFVRKCAFQVMTNVFLLNEKLMTKRLLKIMISNCRNISVSIKIQLIQCMTTLLVHYPTHDEVIKHWVEGIIPLINDREVRSQDKALQALQTVLLDNIVPHDKMLQPSHYLPWKLMSWLTKLNMNEMLYLACQKWILNKCIRSNFFEVLYSHIDTENNTSAWCLLTHMSQYMDIDNPKLIRKICSYFYRNVLENGKINGDVHCVYVTEVLHLNWYQILKQDQIGLSRKLLSALNTFTVPLVLIPRFIDMCVLMTENFASTEEIGREDVKTWGRKLMKAAEKRIEDVIGPGRSERIENEAHVAQLIFTLSETISATLPGEVTTKTISIIVNILFNIKDRYETGKPYWNGTAGGNVQAVAVVFLGRLSLQEEIKAKEFVPLFGRLLTESKHAGVKINSIIALVDLWIKFTSMVDGYILDICMCLRDSNVVVRSNTMKLLFELICEDYLKVRCPLFFHLLIMLCDKEESIQEQIREFIFNSVLGKYKNIMFQHFIEAMFYYNACYDHPILQNYTIDKKEAKVFSLNGSERKTERRNIYNFMLQNMMDDQRFSLTSKLCTDVLDKVIDNTISLKGNVEMLIEDVFYILSSNEMSFNTKVSGNNDNKENKAVDSGGEDEDDNDNIVVFKKLTNLRKFVVSQMVKKNTIQVVVPTLISLNHKLQKSKSYLSKHLRNCLRILLKDYKNEVNEILSSDKDLAAEINYDLQQNVSKTECDKDSECISVQNNSPEITCKQAMIICEKLSLAAIEQQMRGQQIDSTPSTSSQQFKMSVVKESEKAGPSRRPEYDTEEIPDSTFEGNSIISIISSQQQESSDDACMNSLFSSVTKTIDRVLGSTTPSNTSESNYYLPIQQSKKDRVGNYYLPGPSSSTGTKVSVVKSNISVGKSNISIEKLNSESKSDTTDCDKCKPTRKKNKKRWKKDNVL